MEKSNRWNSKNRKAMDTVAWIVVASVLVTVLTGNSIAQNNADADLDHGVWGSLLHSHVRVFEGGSSTRVDYQGMLTDRGVLQSYLRELAAVTRERFNGWTRDARLAFLINAYNAWTVELILTEYPELDSIKDLGFLFRSPWSRRFVPLFGEEVSLDTIEHEMIRGPDGYGEPRIHFAVNCASIGCPALRPEAFTAVRLEQQLEEATRLFLADRKRNRLDGDTLRVSRIFDWYEEDFEIGWRGTWSVAQFLSRYPAALQLPDAVVAALVQSRFRVRYLDYDWGLNDLSRDR